MKKTIISAAILSCSMSSLVFADVVVIVNKANTIEVSKSDVSRIFLGKMKKFSDGTKVTPVNLTVGNETRKTFEANVLNKNTSQVKAFWAKMVFSGKGKPPKELGSDADVIRFVSATPDAIGYVDSTSVSDTVKVLTPL